VLVTARRLKDKGVAGSEELPEIEVIDEAPRAIGTRQLAGLFDDNGH